MKATLAVLALACWARPAQAQNVGAKASGNWETASIWTTNSVPGSTNNVYIGTNAIGGAATTAAVTLAANESAQNLYLGYGSGTSGTLNLGSNTMTVSVDVVLGQNGGTGTITESSGSLTAGSLFIYSGNSYSFGANDAVGYLQLYGGTATTAATGNVTNSANVYTGSTLNLGANLSLTGILNVEDSGSVLNMNNHAITGASAVFLGWYGSSAVTVQNQGTIAAAYLYVGNAMNYGLLSGDAVSNLNLGAKAIVTTAAVGNVTASANVYTGSTLNLGANLTLSGALNVQDSGSSVNAQGHGITSNQLFVGWNDSSAASLTNAGQVTTNDLYVGNASALTLHGGDVINNSINLSGGSTLTVQQVGGIGLTLNGTSLSSLTIDPSSMDLIFTLNSTPNWDFRWQDPSSGGNWISTIDTMISDGEITITSPDGYTVSDHNGYTWIQNGGAVPEPSSLLMLGLGSLGLLGVVAARRRRSGS